MTKVMFILYSISNDLEFWSAKHTSIYENYGLWKYSFFCEISSNWPNDLLGKNV